MAFGTRDLFRFPDVFEEALDTAVVTTLVKAFALAFAQRIVLACDSLASAMLRQLIERVRPVVPIDEIEIRIARMVGDGAPMLRILHAVDDGPVSARRFAEAAAVIARRERAEFAVDERDQLARQVVSIVADGRRIDVLIAAQRGETIRKDEQSRAHFLFMDQSRRALDKILRVRFPVGIRKSGAAKSHEVVEHRKASTAAMRRGRVVLRRQPHAKSAYVRIAKRVVPEHLRRVLDDDERAGVPLRAFERHERPRVSKRSIVARTVDLAVVQRSLNHVRSASRMNKSAVVEMQPFEDRPDCH